MSDSKPTLWRTFFWIALFALIFVYGLFGDYTGRLKDELKQTKAELRETSKSSRPPMPSLAARSKRRPPHTNRFRH
jgi:hypothetical protein